MINLKTMLTPRLILSSIITLTVFFIFACSGPMCGSHVSTFFNPSAKDAVVLKFDNIIDVNWTQDISKELKKPNVALVILFIDSPGGNVTDAELLYHNLKILRQTYNKPIYVYTEQLLASGAYWMACATDSIFISPVSKTGSIGVYFIRTDLTVQDSMVGNNMFFFYAGKHKLWNNMHTEMDSAEFNNHLTMVNTIYIEFIDIVYNSRFVSFVNRLKEYNLPSDSTTVKTLVTKIATGESYEASNAKDLGLVDDIYYFDQFCKMLRDRGYHVIRPNGSEIDLFYEE